MSGKVHVVGAGLAGLSAAVALAAKGARVEVHEGAAQAGGRCRSYFDPQLEMTIDNGNHLVLSGNRAVRGYLKTLGAEAHLPIPARTELAFIDLRDGAQWTLRPNDGPLAWWVLDPRRRVAGTKAADYLALLGLLFPGARARIDAVMACKGALYERLMGPFLVSALNTQAPEGSAALAAAVIRRTLAKGAQAYRPLIAHPTLGATFIGPALTFLEARAAPVNLGKRVTRLAFEGARANALTVGDCDIPLGPDDSVIVATPPWAAQALMPGLSAPDAFRAIVNAHFKIAPTPGAAPIQGVIGGVVEWIFSFPDRISITVSAAEAIVDEDREALAAKLWRDVARVQGLPDTLPPWQIVKERRATFAATPEQAAKRPGARTPWDNVFLAGDWTATGLPATIEGAIQSGTKAAGLALKRLG